MSLRTIRIFFVLVLVCLILSAAARADERIAVWCLASSTPGCAGLADGALQYLRDENDFLVQYGGVTNQMAEQKGFNLSNLPDKEAALAAAQALQLDALLLFSIKNSGRKDFPVLAAAELLSISPKAVRPRKIEGLVDGAENSTLQHFGYGVGILMFRKKAACSAGLAEQAPIAVKDLRDRYFKWRIGKVMPTVFLLFQIDEKGEVNFVSHAGSYEEKLVDYASTRLTKDYVWEPARRAEKPQEVYGLLKMNFISLTELERKEHEQKRKDAAAEHQAKGEEPGDWLKTKIEIDGMLAVVE